VQTTELPRVGQKRVDYRTPACRAGSMPTNPLMSAYQTLPSVSTATLNGRALSRGSAKIVAVAQPPEARTAHHAEPDVTIGSHGNTADDDVARLRYPAPPSIARTQDSEIGANQQVGRIAWIDRNDERALRNRPTSAFNQAAPRSRERNTPP